MTKDKIKIGINGFGRIGRTIARQIVARDDLELVAINDVAEDISNLIYLYNYDSCYGRALPRAVKKNRNGEVYIGDHHFKFFCKHNIADVPWEESGIDVVIDSSGVRANTLHSRRLIDEKRVRKIVVTSSPEEDIDRYIVMGVNEGEYVEASDQVISSSICDVNAISHPLMKIDQDFGIDCGFVTTLHPWLSYQNLVDAPLSSQSDPGHYWKDFSLGRASPGTLIPKNTTSVTALRKVLPEVGGKLEGFSYRTPTNIVTSADLSLKLRHRVSVEDIRDSLTDLCDSTPYVEANQESLIGADYTQRDASAIIDFQWLKVQGDMVKVVLWYDNEWGYGARVIDLVKLL